LIAYFHSSSANTPGGHNLMGVENPAVDETILSLLVAKSRKDLVARVQVLDRILSANHYLIQNWYLNYDRMVYWNRLGHPKNMSMKLEYPYHVMNYWWSDPVKEQRLEMAMRTHQKIKAEVGND
jgi:microcin C transport system substrate-binding protein